MKRSYLAILIASALLLSADVKAERPSRQQVTVKHAEQNKAADNRQKQTATDERGTDKSPLSIKLLNTGKSEAETAQEANQEKNTVDTNRWVIRLGFAGIGIALLQLIAFIFQAIRLKQTINVMKDTAERQLRAYVSGMPFHISSFDESHYAFVRFRITNEGQTPAYNMTHSAEIVLCPHPIPDAFIFPSNLTATSFPVVLFPHVPLEGIKGARIFTVDEIAGIRNGTMRIYMYGRIDYRDAFHDKRTRWTTFRFSLTAPDQETLRRLSSNYPLADLTVRFEAAPVGNDAT